MTRPPGYAPASVKVLVTGAAGQLGHDVVRACTTAGDEVVACDRANLDVADREQTLQVLGAVGPDVVVHCATFTNVDGCETDPEKAYRVNAFGTRNVAEGCALTKARMIYVSTDYVFDGRGTNPYTEWHPTGPISHYGRSKLGGEREAIDLLGPDATIVRTSWLCGAKGSNFVTTMLSLARGGDGLITVVDDQHGCPTFTRDVAATIRRLAVGRLPGVFHVTNAEPTTWHGFASAIFAGSGHDPDRVKAIATSELLPVRPAPRPSWSVLDNAALRGHGLPPLPPWRASLASLLKELN